MLLIIQNKESSTKYQSSNSIVMKDICELKTYKQFPYTIVLIDLNINDDGHLEGYDILFEEIIVSLNIVAIITNKKSNKLIEICDYHNISLISLKY